MMCRNGIQVTVICKTYNHISYIRDCLDGLLMQQTTFPYEIIVHDDCSTDGTKEIIEQYVADYPDKIIPIYQIENIYSKGLDCNAFIKPFIKGKYIAICEGDDYWINEYKLQKQFDFMEEHRDCRMCVHPVYRLDERIGKITGQLPDKPLLLQYGPDDVIKPGQSIFGTCSDFMTSDTYLLPADFQGWGVGDYPRNIYASTISPICVLPEVMAVYRFFAKGSWTSRSRSSESMIKSARLISEGLEKANQYTGGRYSSSFAAARFQQHVSVCVAERNWSAVSSDEWRGEYTKLSLSQKLRILLRCILPQRCILSIKQLNNLGSLRMKL